MTLKTAVNISVVTYNRLELTRECLESLFAGTRGDFIVQVTDNASTDGTQNYLHEMAARYPNIKVTLLENNAGIAVASNFAWANLEADYFLKLDNDVKIHDPDWLLKLIRLAEQNPEVGMAGYRLCDWPHSYNTIALSDGQSFVSSNVCNGGCALIPRQVHKRVGFWNEDYGKYGFTDVDYSTRAILKGYVVGYPAMQSPEVEHLGHDETRQDARLEQSKKAVVGKKYQGQRLFVLNKFLFDEGIRDARVERRYLPYVEAGQEGGQVKFRLNPAYQPIIKLQSEFLQKFEFRGTEDGVELDLSKIKNN